MSESLVPVSTLHISALAVSPRIFLLACSMTSTNGRPSSVTALTKLRSCLRTTVSGRPEPRVLEL